MLNKIFVVGLGPGHEDMMTLEAKKALLASDVIVGYSVYLELLPEDVSHKKCLSTPMRQERERCRMCFEEAAKGQVVSMICSGDAGVYGMASLIYEISKEYEDTDIEIVPGVTAALSGGAVLGAPLSNDFCVISLSDLLTPREIIEKRLRAASMGDFAIAIYNPSSKKRSDYLKWACEILMENTPGNTPCGFVENIGREGSNFEICTLKELSQKQVNMFTTVFIGNTNTVIINGKLVTKRGYEV